MSHVHVTRHPTAGVESPIRALLQKGNLQLLDDMSSFSKAVEAETGISFDFDAVTSLTSNFSQRSPQYLILNVKEENSVDPNNLLFLSENKAFLYSKQPPQAEAFEPFRALLARPHGLSTVLAFLTLHKVLDSYRAKLEGLTVRARDLEQDFHPKEHRNFVLELERLDDRLEDFDDLLLKLQERGMRQVDAELISFDYSVLTAESASLGSRCRRRVTLLIEAARDREIQMSTQMNLRIERLTDVMRILTAVTVILMVPTLIATNFGMNFRHMPELNVIWAYPVVIVSEVVLMVAGVFVFKKIGWL